MVWEREFETQTGHSCRIIMDISRAHTFTLAYIILFVHCFLSFQLFFPPSYFFKLSTLYIYRFNEGYHALYSHIGIKTPKHVKCSLLVDTTYTNVCVSYPNWTIQLCFQLEFYAIDILISRETMLSAYIIYYTEK